VPLVATRNEAQVRDSELLRGVVFSDFGLLGLSLYDETFRQPRLSFGVGVRIFIPGIEIPLVLDLGWPVLYEESDSRHQLYWSFGR
jgi:outer membrane protein assembly factor BamA